jgi:hypothetical protein
MYGSSMGELAVDVLYNGSWIPQDSISGQQHTSRYAAWTEKKIDLSTYPGTIKVRFRSTKTSYSSYGDMAIDNIRISDFPEVNLGNDTGACAGQTVTLIAGSGTGYTYQWYFFVPLMSLYIIYNLGLRNKISPKELMAGRPDGAPGKGKPDAPGKPKEGKRPDFKPGEIFKRADGNDDGKISKEEELTEDFIREHKDEVAWIEISYY